MKLLANFKAFVYGTSPSLYERLEKMTQKSNAKKANKAFQENAVASFRRFNDAMRESGVTYWLAFGTLIGAVREHGFIKHDLDIDVGVLDSTDFDKLDKVLAKYGFHKSRRIDIYSKVGYKGYEMTYSDGATDIDVFVFTREGPNVYTHIFQQSTPNLAGRRVYKVVRRVTFPFEDVMDYDFISVNSSIPTNYDGYLRSYYGNYMVPNPDWKVENCLNSRILEETIGVTAKL